MTADPRIAALAEALLRIAYPSHDPAVDDPPVMEVGDLSDSGTETPWGLAAAILAALPPDWCGHDAEIAHLNGVILRQHDCDHSDCIDREERLRKIEKAARALYFDGGMDVFTDSAQEAANALRAALEAKR